MKLSEYKDIKNSIIDDVVKEINEGNKDWINLWADSREYNIITEQNYNGYNHLRLLNYRYKNLDKTLDNTWLTFKQMQNLNKNRDKDNQIRLNKGSEGIVLTKLVEVDGKDFFEISKKDAKEEKLDNKENQTVDKNTKEIVENQDEYQKEKILVAKKFHVFNTSQFIGFSKEEIDKFKVNTDIVITDVDKEFINNLSKALNIDIRIMEGSRAFYDKSNDVITLPNLEQFYNNNDLKRTLLHEISHATGAKHRLDREFGIKGNKKYAAEELVAELSSLILSKKLGIGDYQYNLEQSAIYMKSYLFQMCGEKRELSSTDKEAVFKAFNNAIKCSDYVLEQYELFKDIQRVNEPYHKDEMKFYIDDKFDSLKIEQINKGIQNGLTKEQIEVYADPKLYWKKMEEIRENLEEEIYKDNEEYEIEK